MEIVLAFPSRLSKKHPLPLTPHFVALADPELLLAALGSLLGNPNLENLGLQQINALVPALLQNSRREGFTS